MQGHPSTRPQEVEQLRAERQELAMQVLAAEGQAEEAYRAQQQAESAASWADIKANQAINEAKALRARVQELQAALTWYRDQHRISSKPTIDAKWAATRLKTDGGARADAALQKQESE